MVKTGLKTLLLSALLWISSGYAFVINKETFGNNLSWRQTSQSLFFNTSNGLGLNEASLSSIGSASISQWNGYSAMGTSLILTSGGPTDVSNDMYFSNNSLIFGGSNVLAVTQVSFVEGSGEILEADIILNENAAGGFSLSSAGTNYIGDVITHEMGHFVGMAHSQTHSSSMFFALTPGQRTLHEDDIAGVKENYTDLSNTGRIFGTVAGSSKLTGVFGAHVQAISQKTGQVVRGVVTEPNGSFSITGLDTDDTYFLYVEPLKNLPALPTFYDEIRRDFCSSGNSYRGGFFQSCNSTERGYPQGVTLSASQTQANVGTISIRCSLDVPLNYLQSKGNPFDLKVLSNGVAGNTLVGFFSADDIAKGTEDLFNVDLSNYNVPAPVSGGQLYLEVKTLSQELYSTAKIDLEINGLPFPATPTTVQTDSDGNPILRVKAQVPMTTGLSGANNFTVKVKPSDFTAFQIGSGFPKSRFFPSSSQYEDDLKFYLISISVIEKDLFGTDRVISTRNYGTVTDNKECMDAVNTFAVRGNTPFRGPALNTKKNGEETPIACGTIASGGPPSSGPMALLLGFLLAMVFSKKTWNPTSRTS